MTLEVAPLTAAEAAGDIGLALLALNNAHARELSLLAKGGLTALVREAFWAGRIGTSAMLIAFDEGADYGSVNYLWFRQRFERFVYVDRVVVAPELRGRGAARALYGAVTAQAVAAGHERVVCEVNVEPPNEASMRMHEGMGSEAVGEGAAGVGKRVRYLGRRVG